MKKHKNKKKRGVFNANNSNSEGRDFLLAPHAINKPDTCL